MELDPKKGEVICSECRGKGTKNGNYCEECQGYGKLDWLERLFGKPKRINSTIGSSFSTVVFYTCQSTYAYHQTNSLAFCNSPSLIFSDSVDQNSKNAKVVFQVIK